MAHVETPMMIDVQVGLLEGAAAVPQASRLVQQLSRLLRAARAANVPIIHLQNDGTPGEIDEPGESGWIIHPLLAPLGGRTLIRKIHDDGFDGTELNQVLTSLRVGCLAIAGLLSEMCVSATARTALARGFEVVLVTDAHGTYDLDDIPHQVVSRVAEHALGDELRLATTEEVVFSAA